HLEMTANQFRHYKTMMEEFYALVGDDEVTADLVLTQMDKLRQISSGLLLKDGSEWWVEEFKDTPKWQATPQVLQGSGKAIVVDNDKATGRELKAHLDKAGFKPAVIAGGMNPELIGREKDRLNNDPECRVIIGQQRAIARGHTLLGQAGADRC